MASFLPFPAAPNDNARVTLRGREHFVMLPPEQDHLEYMVGDLPEISFLPRSDGQPGRMVLGEQALPILMAGARLGTGAYARLPITRASVDPGFLFGILDHLVDDELTLKRVKYPTIKAFFLSLKAAASLIASDDDSILVEDAEIYRIELEPGPFAIPAAYVWMQDVLLEHLVDAESRSLANFGYLLWFMGSLYLHNDRWNPERNFIHVLADGMQHFEDQNPRLVATWGGRAASQFGRFLRDIIWQDEFLLFPTTLDDKSEIFTKIGLYAHGISDMEAVRSNLASSRSFSLASFPPSRSWKVFSEVPPMLILLARSTSYSLQTLRRLTLGVWGPSPLRASRS